MESQIPRSRKVKRFFRILRLRLGGEQLSAQQGKDYNLRREREKLLIAMTMNNGKITEALLLCTSQDASFPSSHSSLVVACHHQRFHLFLHSISLDALDAVREGKRKMPATLRLSLDPVITKRKRRMKNHNEKNIYIERLTASMKVHASLIMSCSVKSGLESDISSM